LTAQYKVDAIVYVVVETTCVTCMSGVTLSPLSLSQITSTHSELPSHYSTRCDHWWANM